MPKAITKTDAKSVAPKTPSMSEKDIAELKRLLALRSATRPPSASYGNTVTWVGQKLSQDKLPPQARIVLKALASFKNGTATVQQLLDAMTKIWPTDRYRQGPKRIFFFYRKDLVEGGHIKTA